MQERWKLTGPGPGRDSREHRLFNEFQEDGKARKGFWLGGRTKREGPSSALMRDLLSRFQDII